MKSLSCVQLFVTSWTVTHQAPPSMEFSRQEYWSGLPFPSPGDLPDPGIEPGYHQPKGFYTFRPSITNTYHNLEECDLSVGISEHTRSQVAWFPLLAKVRLVLFNQNAVSVITIECPHVLHGAPSAMQNSSKGSRTSNCKELPAKNRITYNEDSFLITS